MENGRTKVLWKVDYVLKHIFPLILVLQHFNSIATELKCTEIQNLIKSTNYFLRGGIFSKVIHLGII